MEKIMKAALTLSKFDISIQEVSVPEPDENQLLIEVKACGVCGTDHHIFSGQTRGNYPVVMGHEMSGVIRKTGAKTHDFKPDDRVAVDPNVFCNRCKYCHQGQVNHCQNLEAIGVTQNGGFAEYVTVPTSNIYLMPEEMSFISGALMEPFSCILRGLEQITINSEEKILIYGAGMIGIIMAQLIRKYYSSKIIIAETNKSRRRTAADLDFTVINSLNETFQEQVTDYFNQPGADVIIDATGSQAAQNQALKLTTKGTRFLIFGVSKESSRISISPYQIYENELKIVGSFLNPFTSEKSVEIISSSKDLVLDELVDKKLSLDDIPDFFAAEDSNYLKAMFIKK